MFAGATFVTQAQPARFMHRSPKVGDEEKSPPGICEEAFVLFAPLVLPKRTVAALVRMVPTRQIAAVAVMNAVDNFSGDFARALLAATPASKRADDARGRQSHAECAARLARLELGLVQLQREAAELRSQYEADLVQLALTASFVRDWMKNKVVAEWIHLHHPDFAAVLENLVKASECAVVPGRKMKLAFSTASTPTVPRKLTRERGLMSSIKTG
ncbi:hypothetical protein RI103_34775 [Paraburkholderia sp. FT54]|uniref:hypothetical protein n=1 Tax=Paraburkholderia sp. FT54 TaxID=3074437 RepID=UPI00287749A8|nr:hypothetical protein [Paraburkholderia sp. FT54]WNC95042.1 hypothetical protein RI103_34775 [Paraburkholderia sp. FT54]